MAILKNLIVNGSSRFLNTAYFQDVSIAGVAALASLSLSGTLSVTGATTLSGTLGVTGAATFGNITATGTVVFSKTQDLSGTANSSPALIVGGTATSAHMELDANEIHAKATGTTVADLYLNNQGGKVYLSGNSVYASGSTFVTPTANISTLNATNVNVTNNLRANHYDLQTVAQLGGSFYVSPTVKFPNSGTTLAVAKSGSTLTLTITDSSITSTTMAGVVWAANSRVKVSGTINGVVTGTMDGTVSSINTSSHVLTLSVSGENSASVVAGSYTASQFSDLTVMIYQRRDGSNDYRVGIWMNCYDVANSSSTIRIYGGSDTNPNVMLGNLTSAGLGTVNNLTPTGWGLFAQNAFLHGKVVANGGLIGNWTIGTTGMYYNSDAPSSTSITMIPGGTAASTTSIGGSSGSKQWIFTGKNLFGIDTTGKLYASSAEISGKITANTGYIGGTSGWTIASQTISNGDVGSNNSMYLSTKDLDSNVSVGGLNTSEWRLTVGSHFGVTGDGKLYCNSTKISGDITATSGTIGGVTANSSYGLYTNSKTSADSTNTGFLISKNGAIYLGAYNSTNGACPFQVTSAGALTATSGKIGGWTIGTSSLYNTTNSMTSTGVGLYLGTDGVRNYASGTQYVNITGGKITALGVDVSGKITATSGAIGGFDITSTAIKTKNVAVTSNADNSISLSSADFTRTIDNTSREGLRFAIGDKFGVTGDGTIYANYAIISGTLNAGASSTIGPWNVTATSIYKGANTLGSTTSGAAYFGNLGLSVGNKFKVDASGDGSIILGELAAGKTHIEVDSDSFDICYGAATGSSAVKVSTFGADGATIGPDGDIQANIGSGEMNFKLADGADGFKMTMSDNYLKRIKSFGKLLTASVTSVDFEAPITSTPINFSATNGTLLSCDYDKNVTDSMFPINTTRNINSYVQVERTGSTTFTATRILPVPSNTNGIVFGWWYTEEAYVPKLNFSGANNLLWSGGGWYMASNQTVTLSEPVSNQLSGIVLCWSGYSNGHATDSDWSCQFVPKDVVMREIDSTSCDVSHFMVSLDANEPHVGAKRVSISDTTINGDDQNSKTVTGGSVTMSNARWVLRYVFGV